jgi:hypothetical protein
MLGMANQVMPKNTRALRPMSCSLSTRQLPKRQACDINGFRCLGTCACFSLLVRNISSLGPTRRPNKAGHSPSDSFWDPQNFPKLARFMQPG